MKNLLKISLFGICVITAQWAFSLEPSRYATSYSLTEGKYSEVAGRKVKFPFYVYGSEAGDLSDFVASGYMGDTQSLKSVASAYDPSAPASTGRTGKTTLRVDYKPIGRQGWSGLYWQSPANNWGRIKGAGFNLSGARYLSFWARGEKGGEVLAAVKVGGIVGPYPDSDSVVMGPITLTKEWKQYKIDTTGKDLRHIIGGFGFQLRRADNPLGASIYFDEIIYNGDAELDYSFGNVVEAPAPDVPTEVVRAKMPMKLQTTQEGAPRVVYVEKPIYIDTTPATPDLIPYTPGFWDFFFDLLRRAMEIQPSGYAYDLPLYLWAQYTLTHWVPQPATLENTPSTEAPLQ